MEPQNDTNPENDTKPACEPYNPADDPEEEFAIYAEYGDD